uniref:DUF3265 domain-containing protein n=1 Tax=Heterorhabditis bacteriophora TaxID=37862 RepID=A0A1I7WBP9_HETBA
MPHNVCLKACLKIAVTRGAVFARRSAVLLLFTSDV